MLLPVDEYRHILSAVPIVCVDCVVAGDGGAVLLVKRRNAPLQGEFWLPGGRLHKNEPLAGAVHRKMREEIGVDVEIVRNIGFFEEFFDHSAENADGGVHSISIVYLVRPASNDFRLDSQSSEWGWFEDVPPRLRPHPCFAHWREGHQQ
jgi:colanic acid biosynthesis protein WcaH